MRPPANQTPEQRVLAVVARFTAIYHYAPDVRDLRARLPFGKARIRRLLAALTAAGQAQRAPGGWVVVEGMEVKG